MSDLPLGFIVGLAAEAALLRGLPVRIGIGGGSAAGASDACQSLIHQGVRGLVSFGLAGGLDPSWRPGALIIPRAVIDHDAIFECAPLVGAFNAPSILATDQIIVTRDAKSRLFAQSQAVAVDMESGAVARAAAAHNLPFAVLRAIIDPAERDLPPAALIALDRAGAIGFIRVLASVAAQPGQIRSLLALAGDAAKARARLRTWTRTAHL
jgi:adenosylhomocysteine nucleosidase